jgi:hypothetical protein
MPFALFRRKPRLALDRPDVGGGASLGVRGWFHERFGRPDRPEPRRLAASWMLSVAFHASILAVFAWLVFSNPPEQKESLFVVSSGLYDEGVENLQVQNPEAELAESFTELRASPTPTADADDISEIQTPALNVSKVDLQVIGVGAGSLDSDMTMVGVSGENAGPSVEFIGLKGRAGKIVYVIDRSGSMLNSFEYLRRELRESVEALSPQQSFHVLFFSGFTPDQVDAARRRMGAEFDEPFFRVAPFIEMPPRRLVPAIRVFKKKAIEYLEQIFPEGQTDPVAAMRRAFELEPDLIYFLTDGEFDPVLVDYLEKWNRDRRTKIFTLAFVFEGNSQLLKKIARDHNGQYRLVDEFDLGR